MSKNTLAVASLCTGLAFIELYIPASADVIARKNLTQSDFATSLQEHFNLRQPTHPIAFTDVAPNDTDYAAIEAIGPFLNRTALCPGCMMSANFGPNNPLNRAQAAIVFVSILIANQKIQLLTVADADNVLAGVPDANRLPVTARRAIATAIKTGVLTLQPSRTIQANQPYSLSDMKTAFNTIQKQFNFPPMAK